MTGKSERGGRSEPSERYRALLELAAMDKSDFEGTLRRILEVDAAELGVERVNCWQLQREPLQISCVSAFERGSSPPACGIVIRGEQYPTYFQALINDPLIVAEDAQSDPRTAELRDTYLAGLNITSMLDVPIWVRGALWGVICHEHVGQPVRAWTSAARDFALSIGHIVSMAIEARDRAEAERLARSSEFFMGILSHDLRGPLSTIRGSAEILLKKNADNPSTTKTARRILDSAETANRMIEQLLDFTRTRVGGGLPVQPRTMDVADLCRRVAVETTTARPDCSIDLQVEGETVGEWDPDRLWQLLSNLYGNALEHGADRRSAWVQVDGTNPHDVSIRVGNPGCIPEALVPDIFEPFRRRENAPASGGGLGLGLFIARQVAMAHGGTISLEPRVAETVFCVRLPR